jgi:putative flippase GtrA
MILKVVKFCLVGGLGMVMDFALTYLLKEKIKIHRYVANAIGFICAASSNFALNRYWTFESHNPDVYQQFGSFLVFSMIGLGINSFFLFFFEKQNYQFYVSKFLAILLTTIWNFTSNYFFTFHGE